MAELLLVDNDARLLELTAWSLVRRGHTVRTATSFTQARERIREKVPDLMLSDIDLGAEHGREVLPEMAREGLLPPTLVVSGYVDLDLAAALARVPNVVGTLAKPFGLDELDARIDECLARAPSTGNPAAPADGQRAPAAPLPGGAARAGEPRQAGRS